MNPNLVKSFLFSIGIHLSILTPVIHPAWMTEPPRVGLMEGTSSVELEWIPPSAGRAASRQPQIEGDEPEEESDRAAVPQEQWVEDPGVVQASVVSSGEINRAPLYPWEARLRGWEGTVLIRALVNPIGKVASAEIHKSSRHASLDGAALAAVRQWVFRPGRRRGQTVASQVEIPVTFRLKQQSE